ATQAAVSLQNAHLLAQERAAREAAEEAERRTAFVSEAGALLSESLDYAETFARLGELCVRALADYCLIDIVEGGQLRRLAVARSDRVNAALLAEIQERYPPEHRRAPQVATIVLRTGTPLLLPELSDEVLRPLCEDDEHVRLMHALGTRGLISVPL